MSCNEMNTVSLISLQLTASFLSGGTWTPTSYADVDRNNVTGELEATQAYVTQPFTLGSEINLRLTVTPPPAPYLSGFVKLSFGPSDFTSAIATITGATFSIVELSTTTTRINVY